MLYGSIGFVRDKQTRERQKAFLFIPDGVQHTN
jgi:hypothetical protein